MSLKFNTLYDYENINNNDNISKNNNDIKNRKYPNRRRKK